MTSLFPLATLACALGIAAADHWDVRAVAAQGFAGAALLSGCVARCFARQWPRLCAACGLAAVAGCGALAMATQRADAGIAALHEPRDSVVEATICDRVVHRRSISIDLCDCVATEASTSGVPRKLRLFEPMDGAARPTLETLRIGERIRARLRLSPIRLASNPGSRGRGGDYRRHGIGARATLRDPSMLVRIHANPGAGDQGAGVAAALARTRREVGTRLSAEGAGGSFARALALGDRSGLSDESREAFTRLGIGHLLAVSGLHVALVAGLAFAFARRVTLVIPRFAAKHDPRMVALCAAFVCAAIYAAMSGWGIPVRRALLFLGVLCVSVTSARIVNGVQLLALAALPLLVFEPSALFEMGAQLSFVASAALLLARNNPNSPPSGLHALVRTSTTAIVATAPLVAWHGGSAGAYGLVANLVAVPWVGSIVLPASLVAAINAALPENVASDFVIACASALAEVTLDAAIAIASYLPSPTLRGGTPALMFVAVAALIAFIALRVRVTSYRLALALVQSALLAVAPMQEITPSVPRVVMFDVGQGDATVVQGRTGVVLVDAGRAIEGAFDVGKRVVVPGLAALGISRIDVAIVSHGDLDHRGGMESVLESIEVGELWLPYGGLSLSDFGALIEIAERRSVHVLEKGFGDPVEVVGDLRVQPLWPPRNGGPRGRNERSLVVRVTVAGSGPNGDRVLLTGDLGAPGEAELLARGVDLRASILKVGHHGSAGSSTWRFLDAVGPQVALVSASCHGRSGLPNARALARLRDTRAELWWTGESGAIIVGMNTRRRARVVAAWHTKLDCWSH